MRRACVNSTNNFLYISGDVNFVLQKQNLTAVIKKAYQGCKIGYQDMSWVPHKYCNTYTTWCKKWLSGKRQDIAFEVQMIWRDLTDHISIYFLMDPPIWKCMSEKKIGTETSSKNSEHPARVFTSKIVLLYLHIKLGLMKHFVKPIDKTGETFQYFIRNFPTLGAQNKRGSICWFPNS